MKIGIIVPTRGDRPDFLKNCLRMINRQSMDPDIVEVVADPPASNACDITWRYRTGYDRLRNKNLDVILLMEDDDWYRRDYIEKMVNAWRYEGQPQLFGHRETIYYHLQQLKYFTMYHEQRSSAMNTLIIPDLNIKWCKDSDPYTDTHLWAVIRDRRLASFMGPICIGMKHGTGLTGGQYHTTKLEKFINKDPEMKWLQRQMFTDPKGFEFYSSYFKKE